MTLRLVDDPTDRLLSWAREKQSLAGEWPPGSRAVAIVEDDEAETIRCVMVMEQPLGGQAQVHIASDGSRAWAAKGLLRGAYGWLFIMHRLRRIWIMTRIDNLATQILCLKAGFSFEGRMKAGAEDGQDTIVMGMTKNDCPWIKEKRHGR